MSVFCSILTFCFNYLKLVHIVENLGNIGGKKREPCHLKTIIANILVYFLWPFSIHISSHSYDILYVQGFVGVFGHAVQFAESLFSDQGLKSGPWQ